MPHVAKFHKGNFEMRETLRVFMMGKARVWSNEAALTDSNLDGLAA